MKYSKIEDVMYLCRLNLWWIDEDGHTHDWREAEVVSIKQNNDITLYNAEEKLYATYDLDELEQKCHALCEEHFAEVRKYMKENDLYAK